MAAVLLVPAGFPIPILISIFIFVATFRALLLAIFGAVLFGFALVQRRPFRQAFDHLHVVDFVGTVVLDNLLP